MDPGTAFSGACQRSSGFVIGQFADLLGWIDQARFVIQENGGTEPIHILSGWLPRQHVGRRAVVRNTS